MASDDYLEEYSLVPWPDLPEDIWHHIPLMPLRDAARAACVSYAFLCNWRCHPNLIFTKETLSLEQNACRKGDKTHIAITPGIEEITLLLPSKYEGRYSFPLSLLFDGSGSSIRYIHLMSCTLRPTVGLGCLTSLTKLFLWFVCIIDDEIVSLLSKSFALEDPFLLLKYCSEIIFLTIPCLLERLDCLTVFECSNLQMIRSNAPKVTTFIFSGDPVELSLGESSQVKKLDMSCSDVHDFICYSITKLPYLVPNLINLTLSSVNESINTPTIAAKFLHLKHLEICLDADEALPPEYDYLSLVSLHDASPVLETFMLCISYHSFCNDIYDEPIIQVQQDDMKHECISEDASHMRQMPEHKHSNLKNVMILGFCTAKSMVELTCHVLENATSLKSITLDTVYDALDEDKIDRCYTTSTRRTGECAPLTRKMISEAKIGSMAIERYILGESSIYC
uniref:At1g61320/AtMIF1 LRR domain-containing protein n=1 Tax=Oryza punctata TaxID=4537 RepID=A0A0E0JTJ5_ORYPU